MTDTHIDQAKKKITSVISEYASTDPTEATAEIFAMYVNPRYNPGDLPADLEKIAEVMLAKAESAR